MLPTLLYMLLNALSVLIMFIKTCCTLVTVGVSRTIFNVIELVK